MVSKKNSRLLNPIAETSAYIHGKVIEKGACLLRGGGGGSTSYLFDIWQSYPDKTGLDVLQEVNYTRLRAYLLYFQGLRTNFLDLVGKNEGGPPH